MLMVIVETWQQAYGDSWYLCECLNIAIIKPVLRLIHWGSLGLKALVNSLSSSKSKMGSRQWILCTPELVQYSFTGQYIKMKCYLFTGEVSEPLPIGLIIAWMYEHYSSFCLCLCFHWSVGRQTLLFGGINSHRAGTFMVVDLWNFMMLLSSMVDKKLLRFSAFLVRK